MVTPGSKLASLTSYYNDGRACGVKEDHAERQDQTWNTVKLADNGE
jgi:hypothetical protein